MTVLFHSPDDDGRMFAELQTRLGTALPDMELRCWPDAGDRADIEHAVVWMPPRGFFDGLVNLTHVHLLAAGVDGVVDNPAIPASATLLRLEDAGMGELMAEYMLYGVLHAHRRFAALEAASREGRWAHGLPVPNACDIRVGILGAGVLGQQVARRLVANGYPVDCWSRTDRLLPSGVSGHVGVDGLAVLVERANVLICLLPLTDDTRGLLDAKLFSRLPAGSFLINAARGGHLKEPDLIPALDDGRLSGALLDVFQTEPLPSDHPFWSDPRIIVTPHNAAPSPIESSIGQVVANLQAIAREDEPGGRVERDRGY